MRKRLPKYPAKPHSSGQARIQLGGRRIYLGEFGSPESYAKFYRIIADYSASGTLPPGPRPAAAQPAAATIAMLVNAHRKWAEKRYVKNGKQTGEVYCYKMALRPVVQMFGTIPTDEFSSAMLLACRDWLKDRYCRSQVNIHLGRIKRVWKWGVPRELVSAATLAAIQTVPGLARGEDGAAERPPVDCVPNEHVAAIEPFVLPPVWTMIQFQLWTGCRPGEACMLRTCDVWRSDAGIPAAVRDLVWSYRPESHKTDHHGKTKLILLGPKAQDLLTRWLRPDEPEAFVFSPAEAVAWHHRRRKADATTHRRKANRKRNPKRKPGDRYSTSSYCKAIHKGCVRAGVPKWGPNRLRHNAGTLLRKEYGAEIARIILGHANLSTTEIYAERDIESAARAMARFG
ncbi:MAG: site-specific integrase [Planctomycetes bacterium]|nr:site-specific integrase [Planctomycetota bacterium]